MAYASNMMKIDAERLRRFAAKNGGLAHIFCEQKTLQESMEGK